MYIVKIKQKNRYRGNFEIFFANGIHLDDGKLTSICPNIKKIGKGILNNYELEFRVYLNAKKRSS